jgi:hypothetical protein
MDELVYERISGITAITDIVEDRINPVSPEPDSALPSLYYWVQSSEDPTNLGGYDEIVKRVYAFDMLHEDPTVISTVFEALRASFRTWRTDVVRGAFPVTWVTVPEDFVFHAQMTYAIWFKI